MKRSALAFWMVLAAAAIVPGCGGAASRPGTPSASSPVTPAPASGFLGEVAATAVADPSTSVAAGFGTIVADAGHCVQLTSDANCFSAAHLRGRSAGASATIPAAPGNLIAMASDGRVTLSWSAPGSGDPVQSYVIEAGSSPGAANLANFQTGSTATTYSASGVGAGTYFVRVRATSSGGTGAPSNEVIVTVGSSCASSPGAPRGLTVVSNAGGTVVLAWSAPPEVPTTYVIEAGSAPGLANLSNSDLGGPATSTTATGVAAGTYYVRVRAKNACGVGAASNEITVVVGNPPSAGIDGNWIGTTGQGRAMSLQVSGGMLLKFATGFSVGGCGVSGTSTTTFNIPRAITNNAFAFSSAGGSLSYSVTGTFNGSGGASGTIAFTYSSSFPFSCRASEATTWTAVR